MRSICFWFVMIRRQQNRLLRYGLSLMVSLFFCILFSFSQVEAASYTFTNRSDWEAGAFSNLETDSKEGDLKLEADGIWGAKNWKSPDISITVGSSFASDGEYIYMFRGAGFNNFWRYSSEKNEWETLAGMPHGTYYGGDMTVLDGYVYVVFGGYQSAFARYSIENNSWETLTEAPDLIYEGGSLTTDGTDVYLLRGYYSQDFYKYDVSEGTWMPMSGTPSTTRRGADLVYLNGYIYTPRGYNTTYFYRYDIAANSWSSMANAPGTFYDEMDMTTDGTDIYVSRQYGTTTFYRYNVASNTWTTLADAPAGSRYAGVVHHQADGYIYFFRGAGTYNFWKYDIANNEFVGASDTPATLYTGSDLLYYNGKLYGPRGYNQTAFYSYDIATDVWTTLAASPLSFYDDTKGVVAGDNLYFYRAYNTNIFYRYNPAGNTWTEMATTPANARFGGALVYPGSGDYIYGTRGATTRSFWRYSISGNTWDDVAVADLPLDAEASYGSRMVTDGTAVYFIAGVGISRMFKYDIAGDTWTELSMLPFAPYYGTDISYKDGRIYALAGWYKKDFWEYNISTDSWRRLPGLSGYRSTDVGPYAGASIEYDGSSSFYIGRGGNTNEILIYTPGTNDYQSAGTWTSATIDLTQVSSWVGLVVDESKPSDTNIIYSTRTSADNESWSDWAVVNAGVITSPTNRYLQVKASFASSTDGSQTATLHEITVNYNSDNTAPINPDTIEAKSQEIGGDTLISGQPYRHTHPFFSWSGATDADSEVAGYYVYFGPTADADPETLGEYQTSDDYQSTYNLSTGTFYLRIKTKDSIGNISDATTLFTYVYNGISPALSLTVSTSDNYLGAADNVATLGDQIKLTSKEGFWLEERLSNAPSTFQYGAKTTAYVEETNKFYVFRGANNTTFYEYDITTDTWSTKAAAPDTVRMGGGVIEGPEGYLYAFRGNNSTSFWRYNIEDDTWSDEDAVDVPLTVYYGGSLIYDGSQYIYALRGNNDDLFWRYDTQADMWETLAKTDFGATTDAVNNNVYVSADLAINRESQLVYASQGSYRDGFAVYDINTNEWTVLADLPALPYLGSSIEYDPGTDHVYYMPGNYSNSMFKYNVAEDQWSQVASAPYTFYYGGNIRLIGDHFYAIRGANSNTIYKYSIKKDSWLKPTRGLFGREYNGSSSLNAYYGADIVKGDGNNFYLTRGYYADDFMRYNSETGEVTRMTNTPAGTYNGTAMVYDSTNNKIYLTPSQYLRKFFVYDIATDTWSEEVDDPYPIDTNYGVSMTYDGSRYIYMNRGGNGNQFYRFDTQGEAGSKWDTMTNSPAGLGYGAEQVLIGNYIYTLRGQNVANNPFYRYDISQNIWDDAAVADLDIDVYNDGFATYGGDGYIYAARGDNDTEFYRYSVSGNTWESLTDVPANMNEGGSGESNGFDKIFVMPGSGSNTYADGLYTYIMQTSNSSFEEEGSYESQSHDLVNVYKWANLEMNHVLADNTSLTIYTRSSADNSTWSSWTLVSNAKQTGNDYSYEINSPANRYLQIKFELESADGIYSPTINSYRINYYQDLDLPTNPNNAGLSVYSDDTPGDAIISDSWYSHGAPYFDWPEAEETNGASDTLTGSGVSGYYVYFGTDETADPETEGILQANSDFTASSLTSNETYYFRLKTVDNAGNLSVDTWAPFVYKYDAEGGDAPTDLTADPSGYSATNNFDFAWTEASASAGAAITHYCYKTGATEGVYADDQCVTESSIEGVEAYQVGANTFYVRSKDEASNYSPYATVSYYYADIANAPAPPVNLVVSPETSTENSFGFTWDPPVVGTFYGSESNLSYYYSINALPTENSTSTTSLTYLNPGAYATLPGANMFYLVAKDEAGNINYNNYISASFTANTTAPGIPLNIDIADVSVKATESWKLAISWEEPADTGAGVASYEVFRSLDGESFSRFSSSGGISFVDVGLEQQTYYYKVRACDSTNNCGAFSDIVSLFPDGKFVVPAPLIAEPAVSNITTKRAMISWSTSRTCDSKVAYGTSSGEYFEEEVSNSLHVTDHQLNIPNLSPGTTYYFTAKWTDEDGNTGVSEEYTFETEPPPSTEEPVVKSVGLDNALIQFTSRNAAKVRIYYGETSAFGGTKDVVTGTAEGTHTVELDGLADGTKYYYKINTFDIEEEEYDGEIHSFETLPRPEIDNVKVNQVKGTARSTLLLTWESNTEISSIVTYYPTAVPSLAKDEVDVALKEGAHRMILYDLDPQTAYSILIRGKDVAGNEAVADVQQVTTSADTRPPKILNLKVEGEILGVGDEATAQLIVSYKTDEPSTAQIEYGEGSGTVYSQKTQEDGTLTNQHMVVISDLVPAKVYHLRALSKDSAGNLAESIDKVVITPKATESALDLVITNMTSIFGFLGGIGQ